MTTVRVNDGVDGSATMASKFIWLIVAVIHWTNSNLNLYLDKKKAQTTSLHLILKKVHIISNFISLWIFQQNI